MANAKFSFYEVDRKLIPELCMRCGEPATTHKNRTFSWCPPWVIVTIIAGLLPYVIVSMIVTKRKRVSVPLCDAHKHHWLSRGLIILFSFIALLGLIGLDIAFGDKDFVPILVVATLIAGLAWLILIAVLQNTAIRASEITDRSIKLSGLAESFCQAALVERDRRRDEEEAFYDDRPPRRRRDAEDNDYDRPSRGRREPDERYTDRDSSRGREPRRSRDEEED
jgi:hypothetical protein